jgi:putative chitinase
LEIDAPTLAAGMGITPVRAAVWLPRLGPAFDLAEINTPRRLADFLAQIGHESLSFFYTRELWGKGPSRQQARYERNPGEPWPESRKQALTKAYDVNRLAFTLGNARAGDGKRFMGRGLVQTTGRSNYVMTTNKLREFLGNDVPDFVAAPALLETPQWAAMSAALFWRVKGLVRFSDSKDFTEMTRRVNGGYHGLADRQMRQAKLLRVLS